MDIIAIIKLMLVLLILLVVGVVAAKTGVVDEETTRRLTKFTLVIPQTCMILSSVMNVDTGFPTKQVFVVMGCGGVMYALLIAMSLLVPVLYGCKPEDRGMYSFMTIFGNVGFMGFPVVRSIFGDTAVFYAALLNIAFNVLAYSLGIALLNSSGKKTRIDWRQLINAPLVGTVVAVLLICLNLNTKIPEPITEAVGMLGDMVVPCSMIIIGASLGNQKFKEVFGDWRSYAFAPVRLFAAPLLVWSVLRLFITDSVLLGTMTVLAAMPVAAFATMLSIEYGGNEKLASRTVFVTTVLSVVTIPFVCWLLPL